MNNNNEQKSNRNNTSTWALILSIIAIFLCLLVFGLWIFEVIPHSDILPETFIGTCVALLAVVVTIAVGSQIVNVMEVKETQKKYEGELRSALLKIQQQEEKIEEERYHNMHIHHCSIALLAEMLKNYPHAVYYYHGALLNGLKMKQSLDNENFVLSRIEQCLSKCDQTFSVPSSWQKNLKDNDMEIQKLPNYHWIKEKYESLRDDYFQRIIWGR